MPTSHQKIASAPRRPQVLEGKQSEPALNEAAGRMLFQIAAHTPHYPHEFDRNSIGVSIGEDGKCSSPMIVDRCRSFEHTGRSCVAPNKGG